MSPEENSENSRKPLKEASMSYLKFNLVPTNHSKLEFKRNIKGKILENQQLFPWKKKTTLCEV
jgi:hypothetical protein